MRRPALAGAAGLLQAHFGRVVLPPGVVPLPAHVQGHQGAHVFFLNLLIIPYTCWIWLGCPGGSCSGRSVHRCINMVVLGMAICMSHKQTGLRDAYGALSLQRQ